jgi:hypothetical protein
MWPFKKAVPVAIETPITSTISYDVDTQKLLGDLREARQKAMLVLAEPVLTEAEAKRHVDRWLEELPSLFQDAVEEGEDQFFLWDHNLYSDQFEYAATIFKNTMKDSFGLDVELETTELTCIMIKTANLQKLLDAQ